MEESVGLLMDQKREQRARARAHARPHARARMHSALAPGLAGDPLTPSLPPESRSSHWGAEEAAQARWGHVHGSSAVHPRQTPPGRGRGVTVSGETSATATPRAQASVRTGASCANPGNESGGVPRAGDWAGEKGESRPACQVSQSRKDSSPLGRFFPPSHRCWHNGPDPSLHFSARAWGHFGVPQK